MHGTDLNPAVLEQKPEPPHPRTWTRLATIGDVQRGLRWTLLEVKRNRLDTKKASCMAVIFSYLMKSIELSDLEARIAALEANDQNQTGDRTIKIFVGGKHDQTA